MLDHRWNMKMVSSLSLYLKKWCFDGLTNAMSVFRLTSVMQKEKVMMSWMSQRRNKMMMRRKELGTKMMMEMVMDKLPLLRR